MTIILPLKRKIEINVRLGFSFHMIDDSVCVCDCGCKISIIM